MFERIIELIGNEHFQSLSSAHVFLIGLGGVGGYTLEALVRSGIQTFTLCDFDVMEESNLNRQLLATSDNLGKRKVEEAKKRILAINPHCNVYLLSEHFEKEFWSRFDFSSYDFVIDACDDVFVKVEIIIRAMNQGVPIITCMGTGNRIHPEFLKVSLLHQTNYDPLSRKMRQLLRKVDEKYLDVPVVWSSEKTISSSSIGTLCPVPMVAGSYLANYVIHFILNKEKK